jgi:RHH-type proline utilization regulon transcriptional repressor/proline dehydrogenase/delta 1-pyrroline-5-carboxylate dehydrogenase
LEIDVAIRTLETLIPDGLEETPFENEPERDFTRAEQREAFARTLERVRAGLGQYYPLVIDGKDVRTAAEGDGRLPIVSVNPSRPVEIVGRVASATTAEAERAVQAASAAWPAWRDTSPAARAAVLRRAAAAMRERRDELSALEVFEEGKNWREADADVTESIDYLEYYAREMVRLGEVRRLMPLPGEVNEYFYQARGVGVVIPPWNFPLAIPTGMTSAALVAGNTVVLKPASQSPVIAAQLVALLREAGLPPGVLNFVPGPGGEIGDFLVTHPKVHFIAFTGSRAIGCRINRFAAEVREGQTHLKRVMAEMGGKNAIIVDQDADLDEAVQGTVASAFGFQGQKCSACSRVIVLESIYAPFLDRLVEAARSLRIGPADDPANFMGPVIDDRAREKIREYIEIGRREARLVLETDLAALGRGCADAHGYFVGPTIFADVLPAARIAQEEIFGPVLAVIRAKTFEEALEIAMGTDYALTGGLYSRSPARIEAARRQYRVGNLYINRKITGAIVGRQPFGGFQMSGIGSKAGGPDYLLQFLEPRTITENTMRHGFAPMEVNA